ncbi:MAG TPA: hypothetical protein VNJ08_13595 [Bacteriovoracaceae bacterium]|nr:hypothetical protein [Bacteriovoracaceae bacterium]
MIRIFLALIFLVPSVFAQVPPEAFTFETNIGIYEADNAQITKIRTAEELIKKVIASEDFQNAVLDHTYNNQKTFVDNMGLSNFQIYKKMLAGAEQLNRNANNTMDMGIVVYYEDTSTVAWTVYSSPNININSKFLNNFTPPDLTGTIMHEWLHKLGFEHEFYYTPTREFSVPYGVGSIMKRLAYKAAN